ncbi:YhgE/Pip domain-containing protein [Paenibacillus oenotherae]|uniref:YhgE/Pip domain-containing protein n=1 Tax=Paenibacillus oenotherae TaxID=1435645 RepID=A0ABS7DCD5_9BACL|nr:YhgE/Pip domain-containing protein [Paenibacillus oenotherae]MBW7477566.1 YhgE/Pip domain-containing protein [Paenibacillus oenotherae]
MRNNPFHVFVQDVRLFLKSPMLIVTFVAVACIPVLYAGFLIKGAWDPYGKLNELPVAVVNMDTGAVLEGEKMEVGKDFVEELKKNRSFGWRFVSEEDARAGMVNNVYYATITIPTEFSADVASLTGDMPKQAELIYESNSYYNFVAGQISENATKELRTKLSQHLTEAYSRSIVTQFQTLSSGLGDASEGAAKLNKGALELKDGAVKVADNLNGLEAGARKLNSSVSQLHSGAVKLHNGVSELVNGTNKLGDGVSKLSAANGQLQRGADELVGGTKAFEAGIRDSRDGADRLTEGLQSAAKGSSQLEAGLASSVTASEKLKDGSAGVAEGLRRLIESNAELAGDSELQKLLEMSQAVAAGSQELTSGQSKLLDGSRTLNRAQQLLLKGSQSISSGQAELLQGIRQLQNGGVKLSDGLKEYSASFTPLKTGIDKAAAGARQLSAGSQRLEAGLSLLSEGSGELAAGATQLHAGGVKLSGGAVQLTEGTDELAVKLSHAAQETAALKADDRTLNLFSHPVEVKANDDRHIKKYGYGIAPYFLSIALFAGSLIFTTVFSPRNSSALDAAGMRLFVSKAITFGMMSLAQSLIVCTFLAFVLGLKVQSIPLFYLFTIITGFAFMFICQAAVTWFDQPGRFLVLLLMIFQLVSSAGTFPLELLPGWAKAIHPWMPMTYSIRGFRDVISSGDYSDLWRQAGHLAIYCVFFFVLTLVYFLIRREGRVQEQQMPA